MEETGGHDVGGSDEEGKREGRIVREKAVWAVI